MYGRSGSWVGNTVAGLTLGRVWLYQDFVAGSGPNLTLSDNDNGSGLSFDSLSVVDGSAVVTTGGGEPIFSNTAELPSQLVSVQSHTGTAVVLDGTPAVGEGVVRVWYLYAMPLADFPNDAELAPRFVKEERSQFLDTRFLNASLNLSDLSNASTARTNLGFSAQTAGQVLLGDGGTTFTSEATLFWDTSNDRLGIGTNGPAQSLHLQSTAASIVALVETQFTGGIPELRLQAARTSNANLANADVAGKISIYGRRNSSTSEIARVEGVYTGNGTTQSGDLVFYTASSGSPTERLRITAAGAIDTTLSAGVAYFDSNGILLSETGVTLAELQTLDATSSIQTQLDGKQATGNYITALTGDVTASGPGSVAGTIANDAVTYAKMQNVSATSRILGRKSALAGDVEECTLSEILDFVGSAAQGDILYRNGTGWVRLPAGTAGQFFQTGGAGANPAWATVPTIKSGVASLSSGTTSKAITFATTFGSTNYSIHAILKNTTDTDPTHVPCIVIAKANTGFTVEWSDALPTANYVLEWAIIGTYDP